MKKFSHLNYSKEAGNDYVGLNQAVNHKMMIQIMRESGVIPDLMKVDDVVKLINRVSRFCDNSKHFKKNEF